MVEFNVDAIMVPLSKLEPSKMNPNEMTDGKKQLLKKEMLKIGFISPLIVRPIKGKRGRYQIIDGEQRWSVAHDPELKITNIPCIVLDGITDDEAQYLLYTINNLKGEINPIKLGILIENMRKKKTPADIFGRTGLLIHQQENLIARLKPRSIAGEPEIKRSQHKTIVAVLNQEEHDIVMTALRMTRLFGTEAGLLKVCELYMGCKHREKIQEEMSKVIIKELDEGKALVDMCKHFINCDETKEKLRGQILQHYQVEDVKK